VAELDLVRLLLGVARLGENDLESWWGSQLFSPSGRYVLPRIFPRTWQATGGELLLQSASRWHEERVGRGRRLVHLYSDLLPCKRIATAWSAEQKTTDKADPLWEELASWRNADQGRDALSNWLLDVGDGAQLPAPQAGVVVLGHVDTDAVRDDAQLVALCSRLVHAFLADPQNVPCFELAA